MGSESLDNTVEWTIKDDIKLYEGLRFHKPLGNNRHFRMMCLNAMLNENRTNSYIPMSMIQDKIDKLFNLKLMSSYQDKKSIEDDERYLQSEYHPPDLYDESSTGRLRSESDADELVNILETESELDDQDTATSELLRSVRDNKTNTPTLHLIRQERRVSSPAGSDALSEVSAHSSAKMKGERDSDVKPSKTSRKRGRSQRLQSTRSQDTKEYTPTSESKRSTRRSNIKD